VGSRPRRRRDRQSPVFATTRDVAGRPDGAAVDADGCYWVAANDGWQLIRYTPQGRIDRTIRLPVRRPTMLAFGGRGAGGAATGRDPGLSEPRFAG
jgi:sugar lactone lactonase YvrE